MNKDTSASRPPSADKRKRLLWVMLLVVPLGILFFLPAETFRAHRSLFWGLIFFNFLMLFFLFRRSASKRPPPPLPPTSLDMNEEVPAVREVMSVEEAVADRGAQIYQGKLRTTPEKAYATLKAGVPPQVLPLLQKGAAGRSAIVLVPRPEVVRRPTRAWLHWLLLFLTLGTTTWVGAAHQGINLMHDPGAFTAGLPYSIGLLLILGCHELGHYFAARRHRMDVTPPFFIPVPFALGTFGAFIQMRSPAENRRVLFDMAVAGPLAGLVIAIPALYLGLQQSEVVPATANAPEIVGGTFISSSFLFTWVAKMALGARGAGDVVVQLNPLAFAGWLGLLVTALNLLPVGQLDGGHISRAMFGDRVGQVISRIALLTIFLVAIFLMPGLMTWALIIFFLARRGAPPLNDLTSLTPGRIALGAFSFLLLALILVPYPSGW